MKIKHLLSYFTLSCALVFPANAQEPEVVLHWDNESGEVGKDANFVRNIAIKGKYDGRGGAANRLIFQEEVPGAFVFDPVNEVTRENKIALRAPIEGGAALRTSHEVHAAVGDDFTFEFFFGMAGAPVKYRSLIGNNGPAEGEDQDGSKWFFLTDLGQSGIYLTVSTPEKKNQSITIDPTNDTGWHHIALTFDSESKIMNVYVDYELSSSVEIVGELSNSNDLNMLHLGAAKNIGVHVFYDEIRYTKGILDSSQFLIIVEE